MKLMKYAYPSRASMFVGPQRSACTSSKGFLALNFFPIKDHLVIFPLIKSCLLIDLDVHYLSISILLKLM